VHTTLQQAALKQQLNHCERSKGTGMRAAHQVVSTAGAAAGAAKGGSAPDAGGSNRVPSTRGLPTVAAAAPASGANSAWAAGGAG